MLSNQVILTPLITTRLKIAGLHTDELPFIIDAQIHSFSRENKKEESSDASEEESSSELENEIYDEPENGAESEKINHIERIEQEKEESKRLEEEYKAEQIRLENEQKEREDALKNELYELIANSIIPLIQPYAAELSKKSSGNAGLIQSQPFNINHAVMGVPNKNKKKPDLEKQGLGKLSLPADITIDLTFFFKVKNDVFKQRCLLVIKNGEFRYPTEFPAVIDSEKLKEVSEYLKKEPKPSENNIVVENNAPKIHPSGAVFIDGDKVITTVVEDLSDTNSDDDTFEEPETDSDSEEEEEEYDFATVMKETAGAKNNYLVMGYHGEGLPTSIGIKLAEQEKFSKEILQSMKTLIANSIVPMIDTYAEELSTRPTGEFPANRFDFQDQVKRLKTLQSLPDFSMTVDILFEKNNQLKRIECIITKKGNHWTSAEITSPELTQVEIDNLRDKQRDQQHAIFENEIAQLNVLINQSINADFIKNAENLKNYAIQMRNMEELTDQPPKATTELIRMLASFNRAIVNPDADNLKDLDQRAMSAKGKPSRLWKAIGVCMMIAGALLLALGTTMAVATAPALVTPACPIATLSVGVGAGIAGAGAACMLAGIGFFTVGRQKGMSRMINDAVVSIPKPPSV